ncbi:MAG TPA: RnfH family protein [Acidiferrobacteraceae bacterium]|nr:RnfH family protein [Acidiferrobacteraceae bacterium]
MENADRIRVEVAYATEDEQVILELSLVSGSTVGDAIEVSGVLKRFPEISLDANKVGIFGKLSRLQDPLWDHDRVEIYRPLIADPREVRRQRAAEAKTKVKKS